MKRDFSFYLVLDPEFVLRSSAEEVVESAVRGGVTTVQLREKNCSDAEFLALAFKMRELLSARRIPLIINDRVDVALKVGADGVHLGQSDTHWSEARRILGPNAIVGLSVESVAQAQAAENAQVDYLGVSSIFPTATKKDIRHCWGLEGLRDLSSWSSHALVGIGGIDASNAAQVISSGATGIAVVSAICMNLNPLGRALELNQILKGTMR